jgi:hypothetical protein
MPDASTGAIATAVITLISGVTSAIITNTLNARKSLDEKIWELRREIYSSVLYALSEINNVIDGADESIHEDKYRYFESKEYDNDYKIIHSHMKSIRKHYSGNFLIMSDKFISLLEDFLHSLFDVDLDPSDSHKNFAEAVRAARPKLLRQARSEMPFRRSLLERVRCQMPWNRRQPHGNSLLD